MYFKKENILFLSFITLISTLIIAFMMHLSQNCCFWGDDSYYAVYDLNEGYFDCLFGKTRFQHGGYYIGLALCKFFSFGLPNLLSIHPSDFITFGHGFIRGVFTVISLLLISNFSTLKSKSKLIYITLFSFLTSYFFYNSLSSEIIIVNYSFYRYFFSFIFFSIFWYYIYENIFPTVTTQSNNKEKKIKIIGVTICGFILGTSIEISFYASVFLAFLITFYNILIDFISYITKNKNILFNKYILGIKVYIPIIGLVTGISLFISNPGAIYVAKYRGLSNIHINFDILKEYSILYFQRCFSEHIFYWIIFIFLISISFYFAYKRREIKYVIFPLLMQISILTVMFSLILCSKTGYDNDYFINSHYNIIFLYKILIMYSILIYFDYIFKVISDRLQNKKLKYILNCIIIGIFCIICIFYISKIDCKSNENLIDIFKQRKISYITEKIYRFYTLKQEKPIIPNYFVNVNNIYPFWRIYENVDFSSRNINNPYVNNFIYKIYKTTEEHEYEIREDALDLFYSKGGTFTEEELKHIKFSKLFDSKFVLNENTK